MKKKIFAILLVGLLIFSGCEKEKSLVEENKTKEEVKKAIVKFDNKEFELNKNENHEELNYKTNEKELKTSGSGMFKKIQYIVVKDGDEDTLIDITLMYNKGKTIEQALEGISYTFTNKKVGDITYKYFELEDEEYMTHTYLYEFNNNTYTIKLAYKNDIGNFEEEFIKNVTFKK